MTNADATAEGKRWSRPLLERDRPIRTAGGFYRTAQGEESNLAGVPLIAAEDAIVAAVRMAYKVAQTQVKRSTRLAGRLRAAGDRAIGARSDRKSVDATEELISRALMSAVTWLEGLASDGDSPLKRLALAQYKIIGSMLGLTPPEEHQQETSAKASEPEPESAAAMPITAYGAVRGTKVVLKGKGRPVRVCRLEVVRGKPISPTQIYFYSATHIEADAMEAQLTIDDQGRATLTVSNVHPAVPGRWKAAICDAQTDEQIGLIEIEL